MRRSASLLLLLAVVGWGSPAPTQAQAVAPVIALEGDLNAVRTQTEQLAQLLVGERLKSPRDLRDLAGILHSLALTLDRMATHGEHGQITAAQREALQAEIEQSRLMLQTLSERIRALALP